MKLKPKLSLPPAPAIAPSPSSAPTFACRYRFIELIAPSTAVGKTLVANFIAAMLRNAGHRVTLVRIESRSANRRGADLLIDAEDFSQSARLAGAAAGVLRPLYTVLERAKADDTIVVLDWGGGLASYRNEAFAAMRFDDRLAAWDVRGLTIVPTLSSVDRMEQAADVLAKSALVAPGINRLLLLNKRLGPFAFVPGTAERKAFDALRETAAGVSTIEIPAVAGESLKACDDANLTMLEVIGTDVDKLAGRLGEIEPIAAAIQSHVAAWWEVAEANLLGVIADEK
jgi:hypothetical protein